MKLQLLTVALVGLSGLATGGCLVHDHYGPRPVVYDDGPVVVDSYYYYDRGYYDGPWWVYRDHDGYWCREGREDHEYRTRDWADHGRPGHFEHSSRVERGNFGHGGAEHGGAVHGGGGEGHGGGGEGHGGGEGRGR